jgi:hypothetical protein
MTTMSKMRAAIVVAAVLIAGMSQASLAATSADNGLPVSPATDATDATGATSIVDATPPGTKMGDLLIAIVSIQSVSGHGNAAQAGITPPSGWLLLTSKTSGTDLQLALYSKLASPADVGGGNNYVWNFNDTFAASTEMENFSQIGFHPIDGSPSCQATASSSTITAPSLTTGKDNDLSVAIWASASHQIPTLSNSSYSPGFEPGAAPAGRGPLPAFSSLAIAQSGTATGNQIAKIGTPADNIGCQLNLSSLP